MLEVKECKSKLDKLDLLDCSGAVSSMDRLVYLKIIQEAASNYLYGVSSSNAPGIEEFFSAWMYFFQITSNNEASWGNKRVIRKSYTTKGEKVVEQYHLTNNDIKAMCFDSHFQLSGLSEYFSVEGFRNNLRKRRSQILSSNWSNTKQYIDGLYNLELQKITKGKQYPLRIWSADTTKTLIDPKSPYELAELFYVPAKMKKLKPHKPNKASKSKHQNAIDNMNGHTDRLDWASISKFEG